MHKTTIILTAILINSVSYSETIESGPTNISPTGEMWVCLYNTASLKECESSNPGCAPEGKNILVTPKIRITGSRPEVVGDGESCAKIY